MTPYEPFIINNLNVCIYAYNPFPSDPLRASMLVYHTCADVYISQPPTPLTPYEPFILNSLNIAMLSPNLQLSWRLSWLLSLFFY